MANSNDKSTSFRWEIKDFANQCENNRNKDIFSDSFNIGSVSFALFYNTENGWSGNTYGIVLKNIGSKHLVEFSLKLWFENVQHQKFYEHSIDKYLFNEVEDRCKFNVQDSGNDYHLFCKIKGYYNTTLYICCEITELIYQLSVPVTDCTQQFLQNTWLAYEQDLHDTIIKIGEMEFKVSKFPFMVQSEIFKQMFTLNFKERVTSVVEIKDVSEQTMKQLIKWMYSCQIEDENSVEDLFEVADKYQVNLLKTRCGELMINNLDNSNVFRRLILAVKHDEPKLKNFVLSYIRRMSSIEVTAHLTSSQWFELAQKNSLCMKEVNELINDKLKK